MNIKIDKLNSIGLNKKPLIIAEISGNHNGKKNLFLKHIKIAAKNGADLIKIQTYEPQDITLKNIAKKFKLKNRIWKNKNLWNIYSKAHTPFKWHEDAFKLAKRLNVTLFSTPFSIRAVDFLEKFKVPIYKISSFELTDHQLINYIAKKNKPIILSTGMATLSEIRAAIKVIKKYHSKIVILYCVSGYPTKETESNLNTISFLKKKFKNMNIGLSDHTDDILTSLTAISLGAAIIEKHFIISKKINSLDKKFSIDSKQLKTLSENVKRIKLSIGKENKKIKTSEKKNLRLRRSIYAIKDINKGEKLSEKNIKNFRPKIGLGSEYFYKVLNLKTNKIIKKNSPIYLRDIVNK